MSKKRQSSEEVHDFLVRRFRNKHQHWLAGEGTWPLVVALGAPTAKDIADDVSAVRAWAESWQTRTDLGDILFEDRQFARFGRHRLPVSLSFTTPAAVAAVVGQLSRWSVASERYRQMVSRWPILAHGNALTAKFDVLADYSDADFERLLKLLLWLEENPASGLYLRQLPVEGLDTKWLEKRTGLVMGLLRAMRSVVDDGRDFHVLCGLKKPAHRVRIRILCSALRQRVGGLCDVEAPVGELAELPIAPRVVLIVENLETGLALPDVADAVVVMRLGNAVSALGALPWMREAQVIYWGDIDTHGYAILDRARKAVPQIRSVLMDEATLLSHRSLWVQETLLSADISLERLTEQERHVYNGLRADVWGMRIRLEQERLNWTGALAVLMQTIDIDTSLRSSVVPRVGQSDVCSQKDVTEK